MATITDQFGNSITETGGGSSAWNFVRAIDSMTILRPGSEAQATAESRVLQAFNAMVPAADFTPIALSDIQNFCNALTNSAVATGNNALIQAAAGFVPDVDYVLRFSPGNLRAIWSAYKAAPPSWLTAGVITTIQNLAALNNIIIV